MAPAPASNSPWIPSERGPTTSSSSNRLPPPPPGRGAGPSSSSSLRNGESSTAATGNGPPSRPSSSNGGRTTSTNPFMPTSTPAAPTPRRRASAPHDPGESIKKAQIVVVAMAGLVKELGDDAREAKNFRFPLRIQDADDLAAKYAEERARDAAERRAVVAEAEARLATLLLDLVRAQVHEVKSEARTHTVPSAPSTAPSPRSPPAALDPAVKSRLDALEAQQRQHGVALDEAKASLAANRFEIDQVKARVATLEDASRKSVDPRVRPGSHSSPASPVLPAAPPPHTLATKGDLDALKAVVDSLSQRFERDEAAVSALGKRSSADGPAADAGERASKVQRIGASVEALDELSARVDHLKAEAATAASVGSYSQRVDEALADHGDRIAIVEADVTVATVGSYSALAQALDAISRAETADSKSEAVEGRVGAVEARVGVIEAKLEQAAQDKADDMDLESSQGEAVEGLEKLQRRLVELSDQVTTELKPIKAHVEALKACAESGGTATMALKDDLAKLDTKFGTLTEDFTTFKSRRPSPTPDAPTHPDQLLAAIQELGTRISPSLSDSHRAILDGLCRLVADDEANLSPDELEERMGLKLREWDEAAPAHAALKQGLGKLTSSTMGKLAALSAMSDYLIEKLIPELKQLCDLVYSWQEQGVLPEAAWAVVMDDDEESEDQDEDEDEGMAGVDGDGGGAVNGADEAEAGDERDRSES
ncbi:hypothetical protein JCM9279_007507 [Rhodotorula babjevae]